MLTLEQIVEYARERSPYFAARFAGLPARGWRLEDLPITVPADYWRMEGGLEQWPVLTGPLDDAQVFKTGGTTGGGQYAVYTHDEWRVFVRAFGLGLASRLQPGDRVANLFKAGELYASFLFIHGALQHIPFPVVEYPFSCDVEPQALVSALSEQSINVLACIPAQLLRLSALLDAQGHSLPGVRTILYGGESLFAEQMPLLARVFPNARMASIGYASVDAGLLGAAAADCGLGEHRVFAPETLVEILDVETGAPIEAPGVVGQLVVTSLTRRLMPVIRYPVGDLAAWTDDAREGARKFILKGRCSLGHRVRVGVFSVFPDDIDAVVRDVVGSCAWQLLIEREAGEDVLTVRIASPDASLERLLSALTRCYPEALGAVLRFRVRSCSPDELDLHPRSGKLRRVVDLRAYEVAA